jgi:hypothetical protein
MLDRGMGRRQQRFVFLDYAPDVALVGVLNRQEMRNNSAGGPRGGLSLPGGIGFIQSADEPLDVGRR